MTHACDACSGSGIGSGMRCPCHNVLSTACPVCLGEGRISDRMPARDAVADAETLRLFADVLSRDSAAQERIYGRRWIVVGTRGAVDCEVTEEFDGDSLELRLWNADLRRGGRLFRRINRGQTGVGLVAEAARAAFRAVPGLRG